MLLISPALNQTIQCLPESLVLMMVPAPPMTMADEVSNTQIPDREFPCGRGFSQTQPEVLFWLRAGDAETQARITIAAKRLLTGAVRFPSKFKTSVQRCDATDYPMRFINLQSDILSLMFSASDLCKGRAHFFNPIQIVSLSCFSCFSVNSTMSPMTFGVISLPPNPAMNPKIGGL